ncbi:MAG: hypothetical protein EOR73_28145 [Mesorhizobium sp.]|nr:MAG: hypothetical protein EOR73_28145 [Mesorhizobium sp.]TJW38598.1 MAG: hypothetical protein E5X59_31890 [Mesorhizobium sp.]
MQQGYNTVGFANAPKGYSHTLYYVRNDDDRAIGDGGGGIQGKGRNGGVGGSGGEIDFDLSGQVQTQGNDAYGVFLQSHGGAGDNGGSGGGIIASGGGDGGSVSFELDGTGKVAAG